MRWLLAALVALGAGSARAEYRVARTQQLPIDGIPAAVGIGNAYGSVASDMLADVAVVSTIDLGEGDELAVSFFELDASGLATEHRVEPRIPSSDAALAIGRVGDYAPFDELIIGEDLGVIIALVDPAGPAPGFVDNLRGTSFAVRHVDLARVDWMPDPVAVGNGNFWMPVTFGSLIEGPTRLDGGAEGAVDQAVGDVNGDGRDDVVWIDASRLGWNVAGSDKFDAAMTKPTTGVNRAVAVGALNGDDFDDVIVVSDHELTIHFGGPDGPGEEWVNTSWTAAGPLAVAVGDLDGDGLDDFVGMEPYRLWVYIQRADGTFDGPQFIDIPPAFESFGPNNMAVGDFTADGCADVALAHEDIGLVLLESECAAGPVRPESCLPGGPDADGDGWPDVCDVCPEVFDIVQSDYDRDGIGDACDNCAGGACACACNVGGGAESETPWGSLRLIGYMLAACVAWLRRR